MPPHLRSMSTSLRWSLPGTDARLTKSFWGTLGGGGSTGWCPVMTNKTLQWHCDEPFDQRKVGCTNNGLVMSHWTIIAIAVIIVIVGPLGGYSAFMAPPSYIHPWPFRRRTESCLWPGAVVDGCFYAC